MLDEVPDQPYKGRGAVGNRSGRFEQVRHLRTHDGWWLGEEESTRQLLTELKPDKSRTILTRNTSPDIPFDQSINPYKGCEHGCIYCFARPTHSYLGLSPGLDFETKIFYKKGAAKLLEEELRRKGYKCKPIALGVNTDAYQPAEKKLKITRSKQPTPPPAAPAADEGAAPAPPPVGPPGTVHLPWCADASRVLPHLAGQRPPSSPSPRPRPRPRRRRRPRPRRPPSATRAARRAAS